MNTFETSRCNVSHLKIDDASFIFELTNTPEWLQFIGDRGIRNITDAENYIINGPMDSYEKYGHGLYKIMLKSTAEAIGICGIIKRDTLEDKDIGFALLPQYTGNGYAYEVAAATLQYVKKELGVKRIAAITLPANIRSINLLTKLGLVYEKMIRLSGSEEELMLFVIE